jgi:hypothetical protein
MRKLSNEGKQPFNYQPDTSYNRIPGSSYVDPQYRMRKLSNEGKQPDYQGIASPEPFQDLAFAEPQARTRKPSNDGKVQTGESFAQPRKDSLPDNYYDPFLQARPSDRSNIARKGVPDYMHPPSMDFRGMGADSGRRPFRSPGQQTSQPQIPPRKRLPDENANYSEDKTSGYRPPLRSTRQANDSSAFFVRPATPNGKFNGDSFNNVPSGNRSDMGARRPSHQNHWEPHGRRPSNEDTNRPWGKVPIPGAGSSKSASVSEQGRKGSKGDNIGNLLDSVLADCEDYMENLESGEDDSRG